MYSSFTNFVKNHQNEDISVQVLPAPRLDGLRVRMRKRTRVITRIFSFDELLEQSNEDIILNNMYDALMKEDK